MQDVKELEGAVLHLSLRLELERANFPNHQLKDDRTAEMLRDSVHVQLVVEKLTLLVRAFDRGELATADSIPCGNLGSSVQSHTGTRDDSDSCLHHDLIDDLRVGFHLEVASLSDVHEAGQEGLSRNYELVEL